MAAILFLHGGGLNREMWLPQVETLKKDFDVHTIDLPGHGSNRGTVFSLEYAVEEIHIYLNKNIKDDVVLVGLSLGGYVAIQYAYKYPECVSKLVLSGCSVQYTGLMGFFAKTSLHILRLISEKHFYTLQINALKKVCSEKNVQAISDLGVSKKGAMDSLNKIIGVDFSNMVESLYMPILLVTGENDRLNKNSVRLYENGEKNRHSVVLPDSGHLCSLEKSSEFTQIMYKYITK